MELKVSRATVDDHVVVSVTGEIDLYTAPRLHAELAAALAGQVPVHLVIDLSGVGFCDSTGMNVLLAAQRRVRENGGDLALSSPRPAVQKILEVTGLDSVFTITDGQAAIGES